MLQPCCHPNSTYFHTQCTVTVHSSLVESILEKGLSNTTSFLGLSACQLQAVECVFPAVILTLALDGVIIHTFPNAPGSWYDSNIDEKLYTKLIYHMGYLLIEYWFRWVIRLNVLMGLSLDFRGFAGKGVIGKSEESLASKSKLWLSWLLSKSALWLVGCHAMMNVVIALFGSRNAESSFWPILSLRPSMFGSKSWAWSSTRDKERDSKPEGFQPWMLGHNCVTNNKWEIANLDSTQGMMKSTS